MAWREQKGKDFAHVNPVLIGLLQRAAEGSPYDVEAMSGFRKGDKRFHGKGMATDVQLYDKSGKALPNYQSGANAKAYKDFADSVYAMATPEEKKQLRWGGYFWNGGPGHYGNMDLMHFDLAGEKIGMGGGSFAKGFAPNQMAAYKLPASVNAPGTMIASADGSVPASALPAPPPPMRASSPGGPGGGTPTGEAPSAANMAGPTPSPTYSSSGGGPGGGTVTGQAPAPGQPTAVAGLPFPSAPTPKKDWRDMLASAVAGAGKGFDALSQGGGQRPDFLPQTSPSVALPAQPIIDPTAANSQRQQMAMALARLNSGNLYG